MDFSTLLGSLPAALVPVALVLYFSDQNNKKWMQERQEVALAILAERKEWAIERTSILERQFSIQDKTITEITASKAEDHTLRNTVQQLITRIESLTLQITALVKNAK